MYCGREEELRDNLVLVYENGRRVEGWQLGSSVEQEVEAKLARLIKAYKYKYVLNWNTAVAQ